MKDFSLNRNLACGAYPLRKVFDGLEGSSVLVKLLGDRRYLERFLDEVKVQITDSSGYMHVDNDDGTVSVSKQYLASQDARILYLDIIHELIHVKQHRDGMDLFDPRFQYVDRPSEIEAYRLTIQEARAIGLTESEIGEYLYVPWISKKDHERLVKRLEVKS